MTYEQIIYYSKANAPAAGPQNLLSIVALKHQCILGAVWRQRGSIFGPWVIIGFRWEVDLAACGLHLVAEGRHMQHIAGNVAYGAVWLATG